MIEQVFQAFCACRNVQIRFSAENLRCINCHCGLCRRLSGAAYSTWLSVDTDRFDLHTGADEVARYEATDNFHRYFCTACATTVFTTDARRPGIFGVPLGIVGEPHGIRPDAEYFASDKVDWCSLTPGLKHYGGSTGHEVM